MTLFFVGLAANHRNKAEEHKQAEKCHKSKERWLIEIEVTPLNEHSHGIAKPLRRPVAVGQDHADNPDD